MRNLTAQRLRLKVLNNITIITADPKHIASSYYLQYAELYMPENAYFCGLFVAGPVPDQKRKDFLSRTIIKTAAALILKISIC